LSQRTRIPCDNDLPEKKKKRSAGVAFIPEKKKKRRRLTSE